MMEFLPVVLYILGSILLIVLIILGIKLIITMNKIENVVDDINGKVTIVEVQFRQYNGRYTYSVMQQHPKKGQHVLVLTQDGIRCAKVVTDPKTVRTSQLSIPPFLLQNIICVADASDLEYYN